MRFIFGAIQPLGLDNFIMTRRHHYRITQKSHHPKSLLCPISSSSSLLTIHLFLLQFCLFQNSGFCTVGVIQQLSFETSFFDLAICIVQFSTTGGLMIHSSLVRSTEYSCYLDVPQLTHSFTGGHLSPFQGRVIFFKNKTAKNSHVYIFAWI